MIFTTKKILELETKKYRDIYLLDMIREVSVINTYIGIGYGKTANEAKFNAYESIKMAQSQKNDAAYVVFENGEIMGPLKPNPTVKEKNSFDERFYQIATETGLSANTVYKVFNKIINSGKTEFTSKELATICGVRSGQIKLGSNAEDDGSARPSERGQLAACLDFGRRLQSSFSSCRRRHH